MVIVLKNVLKRLLSKDKFYKGGIKLKLTESKKRLIIVLATIVGLLALFLFIVFVPIDKGNISRDIMSDEVLENELEEEQPEMSHIGDTDSDIRALEGKTHILDDEEQAEDSDEELNSNDIEIPVPDEDVDYKDSSEYIDSEYTNYTDDVVDVDDVDDSNNTSVYEENNSSQNSDFSDNGL